VGIGIEEGHVSLLMDRTSFIARLNPPAAV
jgi:hypothetical protein